MNYWEIKPVQYEARLHEIALKDVRSLSAFVPWAHVETDIYHCLRKFVRAAASTKLGLKLFVMPELGVNYPNAGIPSDLLGDHSNLAVDRLGRLVYNYSAPNIFPLPSFSSPLVRKRFANFLIKVSTILSEVFDGVGSSEFCKIIVSNSLFNYYRAQGLGLAEHGDYSASQVLSFRDFLDREYAAEEFKLPLHENYNRHRFFTRVEKMLREKTDMVFSRKNISCELQHVDLFNPECDPAAAYHGLLTEIFDFKPSVRRVYDSIVGSAYRFETIYLGNSGLLRRLNDQQRSFLIMASLVHSGKVGILAEDFLRLSAPFRRKLFTLMHVFEQGKFERQTSVIYVSASKFSMEPHSFGTLSSMAPGMLSVSAGLDGRTGKLSEHLIFMDPKTIVRPVDLVQMVSMAKSGKVAALPLPLAAGDEGSVVANYTPEAYEQFEKFRKGRMPLRMTLGLGYEVYDYHLGNVVFYDSAPFWSGAITELPEVSRFFQALLGLGEVHTSCCVSDNRVGVVEYVSSENSNERLLFLLNPYSEQVDLSLAFNEMVHVKGIDQQEPIVGRSFELSVPALGVLSMRVESQGASAVDEKGGSLGSSA